MRLIILSTLVLLITSCSGHEKSTDKTTTGESVEKKDTLLYYWQPEYESYSFDTIIGQTSYQMKTYCLNDSAVHNETFTEKRSKNKNLIEFSVAHNFATDFTIKTGTNATRLHLLKENFKDSLPADFFEICHMWRNEFSHVESGQLIFNATFAQPDTDYQYRILYVISADGDFRILKTVDESDNDSESEW